MIDYNYQAIDQKGKVIEGHLIAANESELLNSLSKRNLALLQFKNPDISSKKDEPFSKKIKQKTLLMFTRQLLALFKTGIPLTNCFELLIEQSGDENFQTVLIDINRQLRGGCTIAQALESYPKIFSAFYVNSIRMGEISGSLESVLTDLVKQIESEMKISKNLKKAFRYPLIVMSMMIGAIIIFINFVIPNFKEIFEKNGNELPLPTRMLIGLSDFITQYGLEVLLFFLIIIFAAYFFYRNENGKKIVHRCLLSIPVYGILLQKISAQRLANAIALMSKNGVPLYEAVKAVMYVERNLAFKEEIKKLQKRISSGKSLAESLSEGMYFPKSMIHLVSVGEMSGTLEEMMIKMAEFSESEVMETIENIIAFIEPVVTIIMAVLVLILALSIFLPMWNMLGIQH